MIKRDRRRWDRADNNKDGRLSKEEFLDFLHPEDAEHMREIVVLVSEMYPFTHLASQPTCLGW